MAFRIYNQGELSLAHGWRSVLALEPGRKWITIIDWSTLETAKLPLDQWHRMKPVEEDLSPRRVKAAMKRRLRYITPTQVIKEAMKSL